MICIIYVRLNVMYIFFQHFDPRLGLKTRNGTDADRDNLRITLRQLDFDVSLVAFSPLNY